MSNALPLHIRDILKKTGWTDNEIAVYSALLARGTLDLTGLAREACVSSSSVQYALKTLIVRRMVGKMLKNGQPLYLVSDLGELRKWTKGYAKQFADFEAVVQRFLDQYDFDPKSSAAQVRLFEGYRGVKQSYRTMLQECDGGEIVGFFSVVEDVGEELQRFFTDEYVPARVKKGLRIKNLAFEGPKSRGYRKNDERELRETRLLPRAFSPGLNAEINLYGDRLHMMGFEKDGAVAYIIHDRVLVEMLRSFFRLLWERQGPRLYMTDATEALEETMHSRADLYPQGFREAYRRSTPAVRTTAEGETVMTILGHEIMSDYQLPYMKTLAEIVTRQGGDILEVGYGLGILAGEIEGFRERRKLGRHAVIEINADVAAEARKHAHLEVLEGDWQTVVASFQGTQFDGIVYDGYPLSPEEMHCDGVAFIQRIAERNLLKRDGVLTFFTDAADALGTQFQNWLRSLGFTQIDVIKVPIVPPKRERQIWRRDHFLAPVVRYGPA